MAIRKGLDCAALSPAVTRLHRQSQLFPTNTTDRGIKQMPLRFAALLRPVLP